MQIPRRRVGEVRRVEPRIAPMRRVGTALESGRFNRACARRRELAVDERMVRELLDRARDAVAVERIRVLVARNHENRTHSAETQTWW